MAYVELSCDCAVCSQHCRYRLEIDLLSGRKGVLYEVGFIPVLRSREHSCKTVCARDGCLRSCFACPSVMKKRQSHLFTSLSIASIDFYGQKRPALTAVKILYRDALVCGLAFSNVLSNPAALTRFLMLIMRLPSDGFASLDLEWLSFDTRCHRHSGRSDKFDAGAKGLTVSFRSQYSIPPFL